MKNTRNLKIVMTPTTPRSPPMDPRIWSKLPPEILEYILSFLPLKTFLNLRSTCKGFWSLIFSPSFISKHSPSSSSSSAPPFSSFLLLSHPQFHRHFPLYDCNLGAWRSISLSLSDSLHTSPPFTTLVSSGGLFCLSDSISCSLLVCNPLSKSSRKIQYPKNVVYSIHLDHITFLTTPDDGYIIFVHSSESASKRVFVYHSKSPSWKGFNGFHGPTLGDNQGVFFNGGLYFATPEPFSVVRFDLESGNWERDIGELPNQLTFVRLVSGGSGNGGGANSNNKLFLVGGVGNNGISRSIKLWEMSEEGNWVEVESLPDLMCRKFGSVCYHNYEHVYCFWHEGMICICCYTWPEILYYLVSRRTWHWLPKCPSLPLKCSCGFKWFSFVPKLYALV